MEEKGIKLLRILKKKVFFLSLIITLLVSYGSYFLYFNYQKKALLTLVKKNRYEYENEYDFLKQIIFQDEFAQFINKLKKQNIEEDKKNKIIFYTYQYFLNYDLDNNDFLENDLLFYDQIISQIGQAKNIADIYKIKFYYQFHKDFVKQKIIFLNLIIDLLNNSKTKELLRLLKERFKYQIYIWPLHNLLDHN